MDLDPPDPRHHALDASHALVFAVHDATRFRGGDPHGRVHRLRRLAADAAQAVFHACGGERLAIPQGLAAPLQLLRQLDRDVAEAHGAGLLEAGGAMEIADLECRTRRALEALQARG